MVQVRGDDLRTAEDGALIVRRGSQADRALTELFRVDWKFRRRQAPAGRQLIRSLTLAEARKRYRRRIIYPMIWVVVILLVVILGAGVGGAIERGELMEDLLNIVLAALAVCAAMGVGLLAALPIFRREYRKRVTEWSGAKLELEMDEMGMTARQDGRVVLAGRWSQLRLVEVRPHRYPGRHQLWNLEEMTLADLQGRALTLSTFQLDHGGVAFRVIVQRMSDAGRLRRTDG